MLNRVIIYFALTSIPCVTFSQDEFKIPGKPSEKIEIKTNVTKPSKEELLIKDFEEVNLYKIREKNEISFRQNFNSRQNIEQPTLNLVSSFQNNIKWGGYWNNIFVINLNPAMFIQPTDFINIYASHNTSVFIPIASLKENIKPLLIETAAIVAIENSIKYFFYHNHILQSIIGFAAKTLAINLIRKTQTVSNQLPDFRHYYCSVSIRY